VAGGLISISRDPTKRHVRGNRGRLPHDWPPGGGTHAHGYTVKACSIHVPVSVDSLVSRPFRFRLKRLALFVRREALCVT
jgi:hypothetical protein